MTAKRMMVGEGFGQPLAKKEIAILQNILLGEKKRPIGFRLFSSTPEFRETMLIDLADEIENLRCGKAANGAKWLNEQVFTRREAYKTKKWNELSREDKDWWKEQAAKLPVDDDNVSE